MVVSIYLRAAKVKPVKISEGIEVFLYFCDWTGHNVKRVWLVGGTENPALSKGTYDWTKVSKDVRVPPGAKRMRLYAGMKPATGALLIDDVSINLKYPKPPELPRMSRSAPARKRAK